MIVYIRSKENLKLLATVKLEVVPSGTYVIDGMSYRLVDKPTFVIQTENVFGDLVQELQHVNLIVEPIP